MATVSDPLAQWLLQAKVLRADLVQAEEAAHRAVHEGSAGARRLREEAANLRATLLAHLQTRPRSAEEIAAARALVLQKGNSE